MTNMICMIMTFNYYITLNGCIITNKDFLEHNEIRMCRMFFFYKYGGKDKANTPGIEREEFIRLKVEGQKEGGGEKDIVCVDVAVAVLVVFLHFSMCLFVSFFRLKAIHNLNFKVNRYSNYACTCTCNAILLMLELH